MKLKFKYQQFQSDAVNAVVDLFKGQPKRRDTFTITNEKQLNIDEGLGFANALTITNERITTNMQAVQRRFSLPVTEEDSRHFCVEMETGTGKTYVYTKTIFELNKQYGFTKFIIVVPSVAIREGVYKSFQITADHFARDYDEVPVRCFIYNSKDLSNVRLFATSSEIEVMIINIDAFKKGENIFNNPHEKLSGAAAIEMIQNTNPIVIIDEPQSVDNTPKAKDAITSLNPLCVMRYSATHRERINLLYRLTPVDAYQKGLVKQICVSSNEIDSDFNRPYVKLVSVSYENGFSAKIEIDKVDKAGKAVRKIITIKPDACLFELSGNRDLYKDYKVIGIDCTEGFEGIEFSDGFILALGKSMGNTDENLIKRAQIRRTIEAHFEKELRYTEKGVKVLSLFFIDEVAKYRTADNSQCIIHNSQLGKDNRGIYAKMFEECYMELINLPRFERIRKYWHETNSELCIINYELNKVHDGYFSQDKKGILKNTRGDTVDDYDTYNTIMRDKERLLGFDCPLRFIFSHSALKEGWDNPNVFQVCTLIEQKSTFTCRQKVGRGLRLCVNQDGERIEDRNINILHVMANESFAEFADTLQREIEQETGVKFGALSLGMFSGITYSGTVTEEKTVTQEEARIISEYVRNIVTTVNEVSEPSSPKYYSPALAPVIEKVVAAARMGAVVTPEKVAEMTYTETKEIEMTVSHDEAQEIIAHFEQKGYISKSGVIKDTMRRELIAGTLAIPEKFEAAREKFETVISEANSKIPIHNKGKEVIVRLKKQVIISPEFLALWDRIKGRTAYRVAIDEEMLKTRCVAELTKMERVPKARVITRTARVNVEHSGVTHAETSVSSTEIKEEAHYLPDFLRTVDNECFLSQSAVVDIFVNSGRLQDFLNNPQKFTEMFIETVKTVQNSMEIDGIRYMRLEGEEYYLQEIFDSEELIAYLDKNAIAVDRSVYDHIIYDSDTVELPFAKALDDDPDVKMFFKIPSKFKIETPIGTYNPDWAVYMDKNGVEKLYFVIETKGSTQLGGLRGDERDKIRCGVRHFAALDSGVQFNEKPVKDWREFKLRV
ncbi:MAG: DEAD/DEAH box helicase family protein [Chitinispirillales bacterium]|jgi:type III restriction enzyme|nr:DEAD/DEAH box helicase family protein [Chitinispirillales bacterium]